MAEIDLGIPGLTDYKEIGAGGFATVYSAWEPDSERTVAVKMLAAMDDRGRRRFDRERRTMGQSSAHDNIVTMFRSGYTEPDEQPYLVMEHMTGGSFQDRLDGGERFSIAKATAMVVPIVAALGYAHRAGIVHKDVKPANILISATGTPKLTDFGIAAIKDVTATAELYVSMSYAPPESLEAATEADDTGDPRDERSDLYSAAATMYALITGSPPFRGRTREGLLRQILLKPPPPIGDERLDQFFAIALAKKPDDRFDDAAQFIDAIDFMVQPDRIEAATQLLPHFPNDDSEPSVPELGEPTPQTGASRSPLVALLAGLAIAAVAMLGWLLWPEGDAQTVVASAVTTPTSGPVDETTQPTTPAALTPTEPAPTATATPDPTQTPDPAQTGSIATGSTELGELITCEVTPAQIVDIPVRAGVECGWAIWVDREDPASPKPLTEDELANSFEWCAGSHEGLDLVVEFTDGDPTVTKSFIDKYERVTLDGVVARISYSFPSGLEVSAKNQIFACEGFVFGERFVLSGSSEALIERP